MCMILLRTQLTYTVRLELTDHPASGNRTSSPLELMLVNRVYISFFDRFSNNINSASLVLGVPGGFRIKFATQVGQ